MTLALLGCEGSDQGAPAEETISVPEEKAPVTVISSPPEPPKTAEEKLLGSIRSCDVRMIVFAHDGGTYVRFLGKRRFQRLRLSEREQDRVSEAAYAQDCPRRISVGIE